MEELEPRSVCTSQSWEREAGPHLAVLVTQKSYRVYAGTALLRYSSLTLPLALESSNPMFTTEAK